MLSRSVVAFARGRVNVDLGRVVYHLTQDAARERIPVPTLWFDVVPFRRHPIAVYSHHSHSKAVLWLRAFAWELERPPKSIITRRPGTPLTAT